MEKKKLLLVAVAVGIVLLIIIGIPLLMIAPRQKPASSLQSSLTNTERDWVTTAPSVGGQRIQPPSAGATAEPQAYTDNIQSNGGIFSQSAESPHVTTLTVPIPETAAVPDTPITPVQKSAPAKLAPANSPTVKSAKSAPAPKAAIKPSTVKSAANSAGTYNNYWVQTGAFSTKIRAEGAKESLASKGITSIIDNRDINGKTWYRVRVGPYISETEANYWLALVKSIDGFAESQIRLTQTVN